VVRPLSTPIRRARSSLAVFAAQQSLPASAALKTPALTHTRSHRCWDEPSCTLRRKLMPLLTSSKFPNGDPRWPVAVHFTGIFDTDTKRNPWAGANLIFVGYCSSDACAPPLSRFRVPACISHASLLRISWMGNAGVTDTPVALGLQTLKTVSGTTGWAFKGQRILQAAIDSAINDFGMGSAPGHRMLFGGCSAGSRGAMVNLDNVAAQVEAAAPGVEVRGFFDSPMWVDVQPFAREISLENETIAITNLVNATAVMDPACLLNYTIVISPGVYDLSQTWKCLYGQYRMPFVRTPFLVSASQQDKFQLSVRFLPPPPPLPRPF
jgi:Pectinacetylesterase